MRQLLDPAKQNGIALPKDDKLLKELASPIWKPVGDGSTTGTLVRVESREEIIDRLGYSPDRASAVIYAARETPKQGTLPGQRAHDTARKHYNPLSSRR